MSLPPGLQMIWNQLTHHLGHHYQIPEVTIRTWRLSLTSGNTGCSGNCQTWMCAACKEYGHTRCSFSFCSDYLKPCNTCQTVPSSPSSEQGTRTGPGTILLINLHHVGEHFIVTISEVEPDSIVEGETEQMTQTNFYKISGLKQQSEDGITGPSNTGSSHSLPYKTSSSDGKI